MLGAAPLLWAGNAVVGRAVQTLMPPITLNFLRWLLALALLLPLAWQVLRPGSGLWPHWRRYAALGLLGIGSYNALQYLALQTSTPLNVTLVGSSMPVWMLVRGRAVLRRAGHAAAGGGRAAVGDRRAAGAQPWRAGSSCWRCAWCRAICSWCWPRMSWAFYSWLLVRTSEPASICGDWARLLDWRRWCWPGLVGRLCRAWSGRWAGDASRGAGRWWRALAFIAIGPAAAGLPLSGAWACSARGRWPGASSST